MPWHVAFHGEFDAEFEALAAAVHEQLLAMAKQRDDRMSIL